eukprot:m.214691 g.214691  ORF g.214691 m.214691 type:complete len:522 (+) comp33176_c10_seq1:300-1865(+)
MSMRPMLFTLSKKEIVLFFAVCGLVAYFTHVERGVQVPPQITQTAQVAQNKVHIQTATKGGSENPGRRIAPNIPEVPPVVLEVTQTTLTPALVKDCKFVIELGRSDHAPGKVFKTVTVEGFRGDVYDVDAMCGYADAMAEVSTEASLESKKCGKYKTGVNVVSAVARLDEPVAFGTCCTVANFVVSQKPLEPERCGVEATKSEAPVESNEHTSDVASPSSAAMVIHVLTYKRHDSLQRLLTSLQASEYDGDVVDLNIMIDLPVGLPTHYAAVVQVATSFKWTHGLKTVVKHKTNMGLYGQWIDSWQPVEGGQVLGALMEDDLEVSKFWYRWVKRAHSAYGHRTDVSGYSLQRPTLNSAGGPSINGGPNNANVFMYRMFGTWGFIPHPERWRQFREWYKRVHTTTKPYVPEATTLTTWFKSFEQDGTELKRMWSIWFIKFSRQCGLSCVYAKCQGAHTLSSNMQEPGNNFGEKGPRDFPRLTQEYAELYKFPETPVMLNWDGKVMSSVSLPDGETKPTECQQ